MIQKKEIKKLDEWATVPEFAEMAGLTRSRAHQLVSEGVFVLDDMRYVGDKKKKILLIARRAIHEYLASRKD